MLPTPNTTHVPFSLVYEPAEDSYLMLDTLASPSERAFLREHFTSSTKHPSSPLLALEIGSGSGILLAFLLAHAEFILGLGGERGVMGLASDVNLYACRATGETVEKALRTALQGGERGGQGEQERKKGGQQGGAIFLEPLQADLATPLRAGVVDLLLVNPPYVPTSTVPPHTFPSPPSPPSASSTTTTTPPTLTSFPAESHHLSQSYAGGHKGMEVTTRILDDLPRLLHPRGVAYVLLCLSNGPEEVKEGVRKWKGGWRAETVGRSGRWGGWEKLEVLRVWREEGG